MFNSKKKCSRCEFERNYDNNNDTYQIGKYVYCPICSKMLQEFGYSPDI